MINDSVCALIKFSLVLMIQLLSAGLASAGERNQLFSDALGGGYKVEIKIDDDKFWVRVNGAEWQLMQKDTIGGGMAGDVLFLDVNNTGLKDIFLKLFEAGANSVYA